MNNTKQKKGRKYPIFKIGAVEIEILPYLFFGWHNNYYFGIKRGCIFFSSPIFSIGYHNRHITIKDEDVSMYRYGILTDYGCLFFYFHYWCKWFRYKKD